MELREFGSKIVIRCDKNDEIIDSIKKVCSDKNVKAASVTGIGAVDKAIIGLFEPKTKEYHTVELNKDMEITGLVGNISRMEEQVYIHVHATLSDSSYNAFGGHLSAAWVSCTAEIIIDVFDGNVTREFNDGVGLNLIKFQD
ncbi:PPC domain-containing DNA-binding protein [Dendrosporobacter sp. 1207_IL3150]|uniref:PPC domain-containing DNA-binding protein n=1 Tax=Dendrosporobacter sp. 1207_IL3150 TaxID=3084054 RepID=UPI002FDA7A79